MQAVISTCSNRSSSLLFPRVLTSTLGVFWAAGVSLVLLVMSSTSARADEQTATPEQLEFFEKKVRPLLVTHCHSCHSHEAKTVQAGLLVDSRQGLLQGGDSGAAIVPGAPDDSLLMQAIRYESYEMPPKGKLAPSEIETFARWIEMGAPWPKEAAPRPSHSGSSFDLESRRREQWAWQPIANPPLPQIADTAWPRNSIDHFILARLEAKGLRPAADADDLAILRRLTFDLTGLPPSVEQVREFLAMGDNPEVRRRAFENLVDDLLNSPHFGERWGRHWLDLVRYAESRGHEFDNDTPNAFQYRDYIIRAFNADVPYDQLVREHIAGDLLTEPRLHPTRGFNESILGTGFWFLGEWVHSPVDIRKDETDRFENMLDVMSKTFLGVTVACARCHDHKFDPISTADYYSLSGFLQSSDYRQVPFESLEHNRAIARRLVELDRHYQSALLELLGKHGVTRPTLHSSTPSREFPRESLVIDYGSLETAKLGAAVPDDRWLQDGFIFGAEPQRPGELSPRPDGTVRVATFGAAVNDPFWNGLKSISEGVLQNKSRIDGLPRSGRTLRTPTFDLRHGRVSCRVEGRGHVVACIDSHRLIFGPLHGETVAPITEGARWVTLNLQRYIGHRAHLEFTPDENAELAVQWVAQGLSDSQLEELDRARQEQSADLRRFAIDAERLLHGTVERERTTFADFESGTYGDWTVEGQAFGAIPQTARTIASYQGDVNHRGTFFVNSHNIRDRAGDSPAGDQLTGSLTSPPFKIEFQEIEFLVGGGAHAGKTCVNLWIDGQVALTATGNNNNRMSLHRWDVRPFVGKIARIQILDAHQGGWGNIGADDFVFIRERRVRASLAAAEQLIQEWQGKRTALRGEVMWESRLAPAMMDGTGEDDRVLIRGNSSNPGKVEPRHFLTAVNGNAPLPIPQGSGRLQLADQINSPDNPLAARVIVNRIWHHLLGRGIVPTVDDFGVLGQRPTHPELLDHLATRFLKDGRSIKRMIRYIVLSRTYQMSSRVAPGASDIDPQNELWHFRPPKRLEGESIRDSLLTIAGRLDRQPFGPAVPIHLTDFMDGRGRPGVNGPLDGAGRRSIYVAVRRNFLSPFMLSFDAPVPFSTMGRRNVSNVPAQALILMNDPFVVDQARSWAKRVLDHASARAERVRWMYQSAFAREPTERELEVAFSFVGNDTSLDAWADLAHALINTKEFIFLR